MHISQNLDFFAITHSNFFLSLLLPFFSAFLLLLPFALHILSPGAGGLPYETDGDARHLAQGCKVCILVSLRVFRVKRSNILCRQGLVQGSAKKHRIARRETEVKFSLKFSFQTRAFDDYVFISLKLIACRICVFLSGFFQGSKFVKPRPDWSPLGVTKSESHAQMVYSNFRRASPSVPYGSAPYGNHSPHQE